MTKQGIIIGGFRNFIGLRNDFHSLLIGCSKSTKTSCIVGMMYLLRVFDVLKSKLIEFCIEKKIFEYKMPKHIYIGPLGLLTIGLLTDMPLNIHTKIR